MVLVRTASQEPPRRGGSELKITALNKLLKYIFSKEIFHFTAEKNLCILNGQGFVMGESVEMAFNYILRFLTL